MQTEIPSDLCGIDGCVYLPHSTGPHSWQASELSVQFSHQHPATIERVGNLAVLHQGTNSTPFRLVRKAGESEIWQQDKNA